MSWSFLEALRSELQVLAQVPQGSPRDSYSLESSTIPQSEHQSDVEIHRLGIEFVILGEMNYLLGHSLTITERWKQMVVIVLPRTEAMLEVK